MPSQFSLFWKLGSNAGWSILISLGIVVLLAVIVVVVITAVKPRSRFSPAGKIVGAVTMLLLFIQFVPALAAYNLKSTVNDTQDFANSLLDNSIMGGVKNFGATEYVDTLADQAHTYLNDFIRKALLIALAEAIIGISIVVLTMETGTRMSVKGHRGAPVRHNSKHIITSHGKSHSHRSRRHRL